MAERPFSSWRARYVRTAMLDLRLYRCTPRRVSPVSAAGFRLSRAPRRARPQPQAPPGAPHCLLRPALALGTHRGSNERRDRAKAGAVGNRYPHLRAPTRAPRQHPRGLCKPGDRRGSRLTGSPGGRLSVDRASRRASRPRPPGRRLAMVEPLGAFPHAPTLAARVLPVPHVQLVGESCESAVTRRTTRRPHPVSSYRRPPDPGARPARPTAAACAQGAPPRTQPPPESVRRPY